MNVSHKNWKSASDSDAQIAEMKDDRTHFGYKAKNVVGAESNSVIGARSCPATASEATTLEVGLHAALVHLENADLSDATKEATADIGYHSTKS